MSKVWLKPRLKMSKNPVKSAHIYPVQSKKLSTFRPEKPRFQRNFSFSEKIFTFLFEIICVFKKEP